MTKLSDDIKAFYQYFEHLDKVQCSLLNRYRDEIIGITGKDHLSLDAVTIGHLVNLIRKIEEETRDEVGKEVERNYANYIRGTLPQPRQEY